jgi:peptide deformylase
MIIQYPHPLLRKKIQHDHSLDAVQVVTQLYLEALAEDEKHEDLQIVGLAANQIGIETRIFLYSDAEMALVPAINPTLLSTSRFLETEVEGCGSLPDYFCEVARPNAITVTYDTLEGKHVTTGLFDYSARTFLHELDHLDGILILDHDLKW